MIFNSTFHISLLIFTCYDSTPVRHKPNRHIFLIRHRFDVEIPSGKFVEISSIWKGESTWKSWHRCDMEISTWIWLSKSTKYRWILPVDFSNHFLTFSALGTYSKLIWYSAESMLFRRYWRNHWYWNYSSYILWEFCNNANNYE